MLECMPLIGQADGCLWLCDVTASVGHASFPHWTVKFKKIQILRGILCFQTHPCLYDPLSHHYKCWDHLYSRYINDKGSSIFKKFWFRHLPPFQNETMAAPYLLLWLDRIPPWINVACSTDAMTSCILWLVQSEPYVCAHTKLSVGTLLHL